MLGMSRRKIYYLVTEGKLIAHRDTPGKNGMRIIASSIEGYVRKYELSPEYFLKRKDQKAQNQRRMVSKGME